MSLNLIAQDYWNRSRALRRFQSQGDRTIYVETIVVPDRDRSTDPRRWQLLNKLVEEVRGS